jgi:hypothetical protein
MSAFEGTLAMMIGSAVIQGQVNDNTLPQAAVTENGEGWASTCVDA